MEVYGQMPYKTKLCFYPQRQEMRSEYHKWGFFEAIEKDDFDTTTGSFLSSRNIVKQERMGESWDFYFFTENVFRIQAEEDESDNYYSD